MSGAFIFDLDGTLTADPIFYQTVYSGTLTALIEEQRGSAGLKILKYCRRKYQGKGELALFALNIPYADWATKLISAPLNLITPNPKLVAAIKAIPGKKAVYTGSPTIMAKRILERLGFDAADFDEIIGWETGELFPVKWSCTPLVFQALLERLGGTVNKSWSVGDKWDTDLEPAQRLGMRTALIAKNNGCPSDMHFQDTEQFVRFLTGG